MPGWRNLTVLMLLLAMLTACAVHSGGGGPVEGGKPRTEQPVDGGTLHLSMFSAPKGVFNPILAEEQYDANIIGLVFNGLLTRNERLELVCDLCESYAVSPDSREVTFRLRKDVTWHDGRPFTATDVAFTFQAILHPDYPGVLTGEYTALLGVEQMLQERERIAHALAERRLTPEEAAAREQAGWTAWLAGPGARAIEVIDPYTVRFATEVPYAPLLQNLGIPLLPAHIFAESPIGEMAEHPATRRPIGTGPFRFVRYVFDQYVELVRHEDYHRGRPHIERVIYRIANQDVAIGQLKAGEVDFITLKPSDVVLVENDPAVSLFTRPDLGYQYLGLNHRSPLFADKRVRQAILHAINRQAILDHLLKGYGSVINSHMAPQLWAYDGSALNPYPFDRQRAVELLAKAGWTERDSEGYLVKDGRPFRFTLQYPSGNGVRMATAPLIQADLKAVGIRVDLQMVEFGTLAGIVFEEQRADAWLMGWNLGLDPDPGGLFHSANKWGSATGWRSPRSDQLLRAGTRVLEPERRKPFYVEWSRLVNDELPFIFLYSQHQIDAVRTDRVRGLRPDGRGSLWNIWELWLAPERR